MGISNEGQEQSDKFQFIEQFPAVILRNEETKNLDLNTLNKRLKSEILHRLRHIDPQNRRYRVGLRLQCQW